MNARSRKTWCFGDCFDAFRRFVGKECDAELWAGCGLTRGEVGQYGRQLVLPKLGPEGQREISRGSVLIVGAGGLGCPVAMYLAAAGVGRLAIVDGDHVEESNLHRQIGHPWRNVDKSKAVSLAETCRERNPNICVEAHVKRIVGTEEAAFLMQSYDVIVDCTDAPRIRYLLNDAAVAAGKPLVAASSVALYGQLAIYNFEGGPCLRSVFPPPTAEADLAQVASCEESGVLGPVVGVIGSMAALEVMKVLAKSSPLHSSCLRGKMLCYDATNISQPTYMVSLSSAAAGGANDASQRTLPPEGCIPYMAGDASNSMSASELRARLLAKIPTLLLDVRQPSHFAVCRLQGAHNWPLRKIKFSDDKECLEKISELLPKPSADCEVVCVCRRGNDSLKAVHLLRALGVQAWNLQGGLQKLMEACESPAESLPKLT
ncbi:mocs3 [Symbiodinium necroappetens]|uniref:Mocs3 protein n=1 Tax=Symbiodinium necroappetens TaxID=1628268 RepID=A0A812YXT2_9DINO|nr:mocs3 [Symbiodinium necroappetens]